MFVSFIFLFLDEALKKPLDPVVKIGLTVFIGSFLLIGLGMFLSRPDRSIPPYSIGSQVGPVIAVHLPPWTSDLEIKTLIQRFGSVGRETRDFGPMKIRPTTPDDPNGPYQRMTIYIFSDHTWTELGILRRYVTTTLENSEEKAFKEEFDLMVRGGFQIDLHGQQGWIGPIGGRNFGGTLDKTEWLFNDSFIEKSSVNVTS